MYMYFKIGTDGAQNLINYFFQILAVRSSMGNYQDQTKSQNGQPKIFQFINFEAHKK